MSNRNRRKRQNTPASLNEETTTAKAQKYSAEHMPEGDSQSESTENERLGDGFGKFKVDVAKMLALCDAVTLATYLSFSRAVVDRIQHSEDPGLHMVSELETQGLISRADISCLVNALRYCHLAGIASQVENSFQTNVSSHLALQSRTLKEKEKLFIGLLKLRYKVECDAVQPLPYVKDRMCCVDKVFIQGNIQRKTSDGRGNETWQSVGSYHDVLAHIGNDSTRYLILGDPGYGKSTLSLQFLYDWCNQVQQSPLRGVAIVIFFRMRQLGGFTSIYQAIQRLLLPKDCSLTEDDIKTILQNSKPIVILFDGYDEYPGKDSENSDFNDIIKMKKLVNTSVIVTTRSTHVRETPNELKTQATHFELTGFTDEYQDEYIMKAVVGEGNEKAAKLIRDKLEENTVLDMCQIPLFFTIIAHAIHDKKNALPNITSVTWFFRFMMECFFKHASNKKGRGDVSSETGKYTLSKIAFEGLIKKDQQLVWKRHFFVEVLGEKTYDDLLRTGILTEEEGTYVADRAGMTSFFQQVTTTSFYHKLFCESYAAFYLVDLIFSMSAPSVSNRAASAPWKTVTDLFSKLDRKDLQYLFRFASGLDPKAGCVIIDYLTKQASDENLAILCILEFTGKDEDIVDAVKSLCSRIVIVSRDDIKILQRAKVKLLEIASRCDIPISNLLLQWSFSKIDNNTITLLSGIVVPSLSSLEKMMVNSGRDKPELTENEVAGLINYVTESKRFKTLGVGNCHLPDSIRPVLISEEAKSRNIGVLWPSNASRFDFQSGQWKKADDIRTITELCSQVVAISNKDNVSVQKSAIELLVKASKHDIPIYSVSLVRSFKEVDETGIIILHSGLSLQILTSVEAVIVQTEEGRVMKEQEVIGILNYAQHSKRLKEIQFHSCLLPPSIHLGPFLSVLQSRPIKVSWLPYRLDECHYKLHLEKERWALSFGTSTALPMKKLGDVLTDRDYNEEKKTFRSRYRNAPWQHSWVVSRRRQLLSAD